MNKRLKNLPKWLKNFIIFGLLSCLLAGVLFLLAKLLLFLEQDSFVALISMILFVALTEIPAMISGMSMAGRYLTALEWAKLILVLFIFYGGLAAILTIIEEKIKKTRYAEYAIIIIAFITLLLFLGLGAFWILTHIAG